MRLYTVHTRPWTADGDPVLVKEGFCWPAAAFTALWALWHRMWLEALAILSVAAALGVGLAFVGIDVVSNLAIQTGFQALLGVIGNDLLRLALRRRGLVEEGVVAGERRDAAEFRYLSARTGATGPYA